MSDLSGNLASFGVRPVLELLAASGKSGELRLTSGAVVGRALFHDGHVAYATTATDGDTVRELETLLADSGSSVDEVLREQLTEVFYELLQFETGQFNFAESGSEPGSDDQGFTVQQVLDGVEARAAEWRRIRSLVPSTTEPYRIAAELPDQTDEVTLDAATWQLIAAVGASGSVEDAASALDVSQFRTAEMFAGLVGSSLLEPLSGPRPVEPLLEENAEEAPSPADEPEVPRVRPVTEPVTVSKENLTREEMDEMIRNIGKGIFPAS